MTNQEDNRSILYFLTDKKYHVHRHVFLQLFALIYAFDVFCSVPGTLQFSIGHLFTFAAFYLIFNLTVYPNAYILIPRYLEKKKIFKYILSVIILIFICLFILALIVFFFDKQNVEYLRNADLSNIFQIMIRILPSALTLGLQIGGVAAFVLFKKWLEESQRADKLKSATLATELKFLKSQINPHFLFNMLNNANILIDEDPEMASQILIKLDDLLRYQMNDSTRDKVYLNADISFLRDFLDLEKTRRDNFEYTISKEGNINNVQVAPLLFIPFVENAVKHNVDSDDISYVNLSFAVRKNRLKFTCENSIPQKEAHKKVGGIGLVNIKRRLDLLYKDNHHLEQKKTDRMYTVNLELEL